jgi:hypothetical protein
LKPPREYYQGEKARLDGVGKLTNPNAYMQWAWSWWLAGWNDKDKELIDAKREAKQYP